MRKIMTYREYLSRKKCFTARRVFSDYCLEHQLPDYPSRKFIKALISTKKAQSNWKIKSGFQQVWSEWIKYCRENGMDVNRLLDRPR